MRLTRIATLGFTSCLLSLPALAIIAAQGPAIVIGGENSRATELGASFDVAILPAHLIVLETDAPFIKVFDHRGRLLQRIGQAGSGPGEFRSARSAAYDSANRVLWIVDGRQGRISRFAVRDTLELVAQNVSLVTGIRNLCAMNGKFYAVSPFNGALVHELALDGDRIVARRSLGEQKTSHPQGDAAAIKSMVTSGPVYCDAARNTVTVIAANLGDINRVDVVTGTQTTTAIRDFRRVNVVANANGVSFSPPVSGWVESVAHMHRVPGGFSIVLALSGSDDTTRPFEAVDVSATGVQSQRTRHSWRPIGFAGQYAVCAATDPAPTIGYFASPRCP